MSVYDNNTVDDPKELKKYSGYLSVFAFMSALLIVFAFTYIFLYSDQITLQNFYEKTYFFGVIIGAIITIFVSGYFAQENHLSMFYPLREEPPRIKLKAKKILLILCFILYLITLSLLTSWDGGATNSPFGNLILLTASLSTYVAKNPKMKFVVALLTILSYLTTSCFHLTRTFRILIYQCWPEISIYQGWPEWEIVILYFSIAIVVTGISWILSMGTKT